MNDLTDAPSNCLEIDKTLGFGFGTRATQEMTIHREQKAPARGSLRLLIAMGTFGALIAASLIALGPVIGRFFETPAGNHYCVGFFVDTNADGIQGSGEPDLTIPGAHYDELHGGQIYATYSADTCAPMRHVDFDVQVVLPPGFTATTPLTQNINGRCDDRRYTFKFGVQSPP